MFWRPLTDGGDTWIQPADIVGCVLPEARVPKSHPVTSTSEPCRTGVCGRRSTRWTSMPPEQLIRAPNYCHDLFSARSERLLIQDMKYVRLAYGRYLAVLDCSQEIRSM